MSDKVYCNTEPPQHHQQFQVVVKSLLLMLLPRFQLLLLASLLLSFLLSLSQTPRLAYKSCTPLLELAMLAVNVTTSTAVMTTSRL